MRATVEVHQVPLVRVRRAPACEPPYDDERDPDSWLDLPQPQLDLASLTSPATGAAAPPPPTHARTTTPPAAGAPTYGEATRGGATHEAATHGGTTAPPPRPAGPAGRPAAGESSPVRAAVGRFLRAWLEILNGYRPLTHARALANPLNATAVLAATTDAARRFARLREGAPRSAAAPPRLRLGRVRLFQPTPHAVEVAAVLTSHRHAWALALRLEQHQGRWLCVALDVLWGNHLADQHPG